MTAEDLQDDTSLKRIIRRILAAGVRLEHTAGISDNEDEDPNDNSVLERGTQRAPRTGASGPRFKTERISSAAPAMDVDRDADEEMVDQSAYVNLGDGQDDRDKDDDEDLYS